MTEEFNVGKKIKKLRKQKAMNAKDLAEEVGISYGMLSLLESGSTHGSVETLRKIAKVLDTTLAQLFTNEDNINEEITDESMIIVRKDKRKKISFPDPLYNCELLVPNLQGDIEFLLVHLEAQRITEDIIPHTKGGEECDYVLKGEIIITLQDKEYILEEGDCIRFNPAIPHKIENKTNTQASYLSVITPVSF
ncbi:helix-turn-helix domain-containing protein [Arcobacter sp. s6]|uniref:helix-turn-helix domain-containing protein n=1 Tax=Arcobacter sp. s6 TaxID=3230363 RepID=UPI0034A06F3A